MNIDKKELNSESISRRKFLRDSGLILGGAGLSSILMANACDSGTNTATVTQPITITVADPNTVGKKTTTIAVTINNQPYIAEIKTSSTLQDFLREQVGLLSPKDMCYGYGACGSCSVIMNARPVLSCMVLAAECDGANIITAEEIAASNPVLVDAYIANHCMQCGYCTPGFLVTSQALLNRIPKPSEKDIREALGGNICRCATYSQHIKAILEITAGK
ncbi:MAG: (2Fe-2S)-binding protein [Dehalococcoidia bacterium]|nr:(2Fe-2S)-binding protein [Dehalococcoidia bacterium]